MDRPRHTAAKCNYCSHRVDIGLEPACVNVCPEHAIISGDMDNPQSEISRLLARETVSVRKPEKGTNPKLFYIDGDRSSLDPSEANPDTEYMWSSQSSGVGHFAKFAEERIKAKEKNDVPQTLYQIESNGAKNKPRRVYDAPSKGVLWGWEVGAYVWTKGIAAGAFLVPIITGYFVDIPYQMKQLGAWIRDDLSRFDGNTLDQGPRPTGPVFICPAASAMAFVANTWSVHHYRVRRCIGCLDRR